MSQSLVVGGENPAPGMAPSSLAAGAHPVACDAYAHSKPAQESWRLAEGHPAQQQGPAQLGGNSGSCLINPMSPCSIAHCTPQWRTRRTGAGRKAPQMWAPRTLPRAPSSILLYSCWSPIRRGGASISARCRPMCIRNSAE